MNWGVIGGRICVALVYAVFGFASYFYLYRLGFRWATSNWLLWWPLLDITLRIMMALWSHTYCMLSDPGFTSESSSAFVVDQRSGDSWQPCSKCKNVRFPRTHHCSVCTRCVEKMDHHCPWVNNCVGVKNHKSFLLFLAYTSSAAVECVLLLALRLITCPSVSKSFVLLGLRMVIGEAKVRSLLGKEEADPFVEYEETCDFTIEYSFVGIAAFILALVFLIFISFIATDQIARLVHNQTGIEQLKNERGPARPLRETVVEVMGMEPSLWWLVPVDWRTRHCQSSSSKSPDLKME